VVLVAGRDAEYVEDLLRPVKTLDEGRETGLCGAVGRDEKQYKKGGESAVASEGAHPGDSIRVYR
jgi:hypothetical protein